MPPIVVVSLAPAIANVLLIIAVVARHLLVGRRTRRVETLAARLRLPAIELVEGDGPIEPPELNGAETKVFADLLVQYGRQLTGASRDRIVAYWESSGLLDEQVRRLQSYFPWKRADGGVHARRRRAAPCRSVARRPARRSGTRRPRCGGPEPRPPRRRRGDRTPRHRLRARTAPPRRRRHGAARHRTTRGRASRRAHASRGFGSPDVGRAAHRPHRRRRRTSAPSSTTSSILPPRSDLRRHRRSAGSAPARRATRWSSRSAIACPTCERRRHERSVRSAGSRRPRL